MLCRGSSFSHLISFRTRTFASETRIFPAVKRLSDIVVEKGKGCEVWTTDGKRYLDATSGIGVLSTGHCHPTVVEAVREQAGKISHAQQSCYFNSTVNKLVERLGHVVPAGLDSFFFTNSGAEAVEAALKLARQATGRDTIVAFLGGYHGRTIGTLAVTSSSPTYRGERSGPMPGGTAWARYPYEHAGVSKEAALESLDLLLAQQTNASDIAAVIIEPVLGEGGYVVPPDGFMSELRSWCTSNDILLITDEVQCGFGRTGKQWAVNHWDVVPDILVSAKGIASGYPLSMVATRPELSAKQWKGCMGGTYGGNAVACAAALATLDVFEQEGVVENSRLRGAQLMEGLRSMKPDALAAVGDIRGLGLMVAVEFDRSIVGKGFAAKVSSESFNRGVLLLPTGHRETIRLIPPLTVSSSEIDELVQTAEVSILAAL